MNSREKILAAVKNSQPPLMELPPVHVPPMESSLLEKFSSVLASIGGTLFVVRDFAAIGKILEERAGEFKRIVSTCPELSAVAETDIRYNAPQEFADIDLAIIRAHFGVAENAAVWVTEDLLPERALPFICEHLAVVLHRKDLVATMHEAYERIGSADYGFGVFIAGPSKTADIEQSLVLGAHGPGTMMIFLLDSGSY